MAGPIRANIIEGLRRTYQRRYARHCRCGDRRHRQGDELGVDIEQMRQGKTPYELAIAFLGMSQSERDAALAAAKGHAKWGEIQTEAKKWMGLQ